MKTLAILLLLLIAGCATGPATTEQTLARLGGRLENTVRAIELADTEGQLAGNPWLAAAKTLSIGLQTNTSTPEGVTALIDALRDLDGNLVAALRAAGVEENWQVALTLSGYYEVLSELEWQILQWQAEQATELPEPSPTAAPPEDPPPP